METNGRGGLARLGLGVAATVVAIGITAVTLGNGSAEALGGAVAALAAGLLWYRLTAPARVVTAETATAATVLDDLDTIGALASPSRAPRRVLELPEPRTLPGSVAADIRRAASRVRAVRGSVDPGSSFDRRLDEAVAAIVATSEAWTALPAPVPDATYRAYCRMVRHQVAEVTRLEADVWASRVGDPAPPFTSTPAAEQIADVALPQSISFDHEEQPRAEIVALHERRVARALARDPWAAALDGMDADEP